MKKKMRGVGLSLLMLCCGAMSFAESPTPTPQKCFDFDTGTNSIIGKYHFSDPDCPKDIVFPDEMTVDGVNYKVHVIGKNFANYRSYSGYLERVIFPKYLKKIEMNAFIGQYRLHTVKFNEWLQEIGEGAFYVGDFIEKKKLFQCSDTSIKWSLTHIDLPKSLSKIWWYAFTCQSLTNNLKLPPKITQIGKKTFEFNKLKTVELSAELKEIGVRAFAGNPWLPVYDNKVVGFVTKDPSTITVANDANIAFVRKEVKLTFDLDGGTGTTLLTGFVDTPFPGVSDPIKTWYVFSGWTPALPNTFKEDQDFKANWQRAVYTLTFDLDGGMGTTLLTGLYNDPLNVVDPTKTGYVFSGRNPTLPSAITGDQSFKAEWKKDQSSWGSSSSSSWGGYSGGGGSSHSSTSSSSTSSTQQKPETPANAEPVKTEQVKTEIFNPTIQTTCFNPLDKQTIDQGNKISELLRIAHQMLYSYSLTKWQGTKDFAPERSLTREEAARFMTEFATNVLCRKASRTYNDHFTDLEKVNPELLPYIKKSYEYLIFNGDSNAEGKKEKTTFRPKELITVGELSAIMTRLVRNELLQEVQGDRSKNYRTYINAITPKSDLKNGVRGTVAEVIYDLYRNNSYELKDIGYVIKK